MGDEDGHICSIVRCEHDAIADATAEVAGEERKIHLCHMHLQMAIFNVIWWESLKPATSTQQPAG